METGAQGTDIKYIINLLSRVDLFKDLPPPLLPNIAVQFTTVRFKANDVVIKQDQKIKNLFIIARGRLEVYLKDQAGRQTHIAYLLPKDYFGDSHLLYDHPATTAIRAVEDTECLCLSKEHFLVLLEIDPEISQQILRAILRHVRKIHMVEEAAKYKEKALQFLQQNRRVGQYTAIIGKTRAVRELNEAIQRIAFNDQPVLIEGEFGTGKELVARIIHEKSARSQKPFISVDCEKLAPDTMESQLFGERFLYGVSPVEYGVGFSYVELAEGGTLLFKNIEVLPMEILVRIQELLLSSNHKNDQKAGLQFPDVRVMATSRVDLNIRVEKGEFDRILFQSLSLNRILIPPLMERKRDIPELAEHFVEKYARYYNKGVDKISDAAMKALVAHDYKLYNIQELEKAVERAVTLTRSDTIRSEHIFLGLPPGKPLVLVNLLHWRFFKEWIRRRIFPEKIRELVAIVFLLVIGLSLFSHQLPYPYNNVGRILTWSFWWPFMFLSFFFVGRFWCSVCPYATYSHLGKRIVNKELHFPFKQYDFLFMTLGFLFVIWVEEISGMRHSAFKVGLLQLSILTLAVIMGMIYRRDSWCRFICPLGALISTCSMASIVEVRSDPEICTNQCTTQDCYKGTQEIPGCPMFQHLMFVDNNQTCKLCMNCVRSCTHDNISVNIRPPATEIYSSERLNRGLFLFVVALMGILIPIVMMHKGLISQKILPFTFIYLLTPALILFMLWVITEMGFKGKDQSGWAILWRLTYAYIPLALAAHIAYQLQFLPIVSNLLFSVLLSPSISTNIVIYTRTLFSLFKVVYLFFEFILLFKLVAYILIAFKKVDLKESRSGLWKPILSSLMVSIVVYCIPTINSYVFSKLRPAAESATVVYSVPLFHVFQIIIVILGIILTLYCLFRILAKIRELNMRSNRLLAASQLLFMIFYAVLVLYLLIL